MILPSPPQVPFPLGNESEEAGEYLHAFAYPSCRLPTSLGKGKGKSLSLKPAPILSGMWAFAHSRKQAGQLLKTNFW